MLKQPIIAPNSSEIEKADFPGSLTALFLMSRTTFETSAFPQLMECLPQLRSLTIVPAVRYFNGWIDTSVFPPNLHTLTTVNCALKLGIPSETSSIKVLRSYHTCDISRHVAPNPRIEKFSFQYNTAQSIQTIGILSQGLMPSLKNLEVVVVGSRGDAQQEDQLAHMRHLCENNQIRFDVQRVNERRAKTVSNYLHEYLGVINRATSCWA